MMKRKAIENPKLATMKYNWDVPQVHFFKSLADRSILLPANQMSDTSSSKGKFDPDRFSQ